MTREEALKNGQKWSYGYSSSTEFREKVRRDLPRGFKQYDLEMFFFLNYETFPTDISRDEHWWRAAERRWPETDADGNPGPLKRNPWAEAFIRAASKYSIVNIMGGGGQGKTTIIIAFGITIYDYYNWTFKGAKFTVSSVNEKKLRGAAWPTIEDLYKKTNTGCSPSVGQGQIFDLIIKRPKGSKMDYSSKASIQAILIGNSNKTALQVDAITGSHIVGSAQVLFIDEAQSASDALNKAAYNLRTHAKPFWMFRAGNPDSEDDYLGKACEPVGGYDAVNPLKVDDPDTEWVTHYDGQVGYVLRFDNDYSPGILDPKKYPYMPGAEARDETYSTPESKRTAGYFRFWKCWFVPEFADESVIKWSIIEQMGCHKWVSQNTKFTEIKNAISFDSAPASLDRSPLTHFQLCRDPEADHKLVLNFQSVFLLPKTDPDTFWQKAVDISLERAREWQAPSGNLICDDTAHTGFPNMLAQKGFRAMRMIYHQSPTERFIDPAVRKKAKDHCADLITEAALILEAYIRYGQVRGLGDSLCAKFREEVCSRRMDTLPGGKVRLESKAKSFRTRMGFSPDIFDTLAQAAFFAREVWGFLPGIDKGSSNGGDTSRNPKAPTASIRFNRKFLTNV